MNVTVRAEKLNEKMGSFVKFACFLPELWSINCPKKCIFYNFVLTSAGNLSLLKQFTYMHPESSHYNLSENATVYRGLSYRS